MKIDILDVMHKGTPFLKYGKSGYPHFRLFVLSTDNCSIMWFSKQKKMKESLVRLSDIDEIRNGQTTAVFKRYLAPELARSSFSIIYNRRRSSLDVIAKDNNEFKIWTSGLRKLLEMVKGSKVTEVMGMRRLVMTLSITRGRRSTNDLKDADTGERAEEGDGEVVLKTGAGNKQLYKPVLKSLQALKKKLARKRTKLAHQAFYEHPLYASMQELIRKVQASVDRLNDWFLSGEYYRCDDEIWRAGVDLESLSNMLAAVKARK